MEEILNTIPNPFDRENFKRILDIYLESKNWEELYSKIVTYYQDRDMQKRGPKVKKPNCFVIEEPLGDWKKLEYFSSYFPTEHRIYINSSLDSTGPIVQKFIDECVKEDIPFELKYIDTPTYKSAQRNDGIVIGSNTSVYGKHIEILKKIAKENPELIEKCGTPHILTANLDGWMGLADENINERTKSYTQSRLDIIELSIMKFLLKHEELGEKVDGFEKVKNRYISSIDYVNGGIEDGYINSEDYELKLSKNFFTRSNNLDKKALSLILNNNENAFQEIYSIFQKECEIQGIDPYMPTLYKGSREALINVDKADKINSKVNLEGKSPVLIINEYLKSAGKDLSMEDEIQVLKSIDERFYQNSKLMDFMFENLSFLMNEGLINEDEIDINFLKELIHANSYFMDSAVIKPSFKKYPHINSLIYSEGEDVSLEKAREIINSRINETFSYFEIPIESVEEKKKSIECLKLLMEYYKSVNHYFNQTDSCDKINKKIKYLEFEVEHDSEIRGLYEATGLAIKNKNISDEEIRKVVQDSMPKVTTEYNSFQELMGGSPIVYIEEKPQDISKEGFDEYRIFLKRYLEQSQKQIAFSARDIGEASYDADTKLCIELDKIIGDLQKGVEKDGQNK